MKYASCIACVTSEEREDVKTSVSHVTGVRLAAIDSDIP